MSQQLPKERVTMQISAEKNEDNVFVTSQGVPLVDAVVQLNSVASAVQVSAIYLWFNSNTYLQIEFKSSISISSIESCVLAVGPKCQLSVAGVTEEDSISALDQLGVESIVRPSTERILLTEALGCKFCASERRITTFGRRLSFHSQERSVRVFIFLPLKLLQGWMACGRHWLSMNVVLPLESHFPTC